VDKYTRECLALKVDRGITAEDVIDTLAELFSMRGVPQASLAAARKLSMAWKEDYNHHRPHSSLGCLTPVEFAARCAASVTNLPSPTAQARSPLQQHSGVSLTTTFHTGWYRNLMLVSAASQFECDGESRTARRQ